MEPAAISARAGKKPISAADRDERCQFHDRQQKHGQQQVFCHIHRCFLPLSGLAMTALSFKVGQ